MASPSSSVAARRRPNRCHRSRSARPGRGIHAARRRRQRRRAHEVGSDGRSRTAAEAERSSTKASSRCASNESSSLPPAALARALVFDSRTGATRAQTTSSQRNSPRTPPRSSWRQRRCRARCTRARRRRADSLGSSSALGGAGGIGEFFEARGARGQLDQITQGIGCLDRTLREDTDLGGGKPVPAEWAWRAEVTVPHVLQRRDGCGRTRRTCPKPPQASPEPSRTRFGEGSVSITRGVNARHARAPRLARSRRGGSRAPTPRRRRRHRVRPNPPRHATERRADFSRSHMPASFGVTRGGVMRES